MNKKKVTALLMALCLVVSLATNAFAMANFKQSGEIADGVMTMTLSFDVPEDGNIRVFSTFISFDADVLALYDGSGEITVADGARLDNVENTDPYDPLKPFVLGGAVVAKDNFVYANTRLAKADGRYLLDLGFFAFDEDLEDVTESDGKLCVDVNFKVLGDLDHTSIRFADEGLDNAVLLAMASNALQKRAAIVSWIEGGESKYLVHKSFDADINYGNEPSMLKDLVYPGRYRIGIILDPDHLTNTVPSPAEVLTVILASLAESIDDFVDAATADYREEQVRSMNLRGEWDIPSPACVLTTILASLN